MDKKEETNKLKLSELKNMEVIDVAEGRRLGFIGDIVFDEELTYIKSFVIPYQSGIFSVFKKKDEIEITWDQIKVIGVDIMLVDLLNKNASEEKRI
ncbi:MAG: YlmC/YmxH family sporulation protein [Clostridium sp.]|uniref:YlmC/YmxH family sporulation protein n=1 Tax=Clostridium sp. TaxID=1506 RepID=UPI002FCAC3C9